MITFLIVSIFLTCCGCLKLEISKGKDSHPVPTYFRKTDDQGHFIDRKNPEFEKALQQPIIGDLSAASDAILKVTPSIAKNGQNVAVSWLGIANSGEKDIIAFYCPYNDNATHYLDYINVNSVQSWRHGYGNISVVVYNMRSVCAFRYYSVRSTSSQLVTVSNLLSFGKSGNEEPLQGHIALTEDPSEMKVVWVAGKTTGQPIVWYGRTPALGLSEGRVQVTTYDASDMCESPANSTGFWHPGYIYIVLLRNLIPNTKYFYQYGTKTHKSKIFHFMTSIPAGSPIPYKFIVYGDMGIAPPPQGVSTAHHVYTDITGGRNTTSDINYRFIFHNGDISYAMGYAYIWDQWFSIIEPYATLVPYMVGIGNHEQDHRTGGKKDPSGAPGESSFRPVWGDYNSDSRGECGVPMYKRFYMPSNGNGLWWYSYDYGLVHYIMMSTEHDFSPGSRQYRWLENDLKNVNRSKTPWVLLGGHRAMYCSSLQALDYVVSINMQRLFEDLLYHYKVDIAIWAHYHLYERTCKVYKGKCVEDGVVHIVVGSAGRTTDPDVWLKKEWSLFRRNDYGYARVHVANATSLNWEWVENRSYKTVDSIWFHKSG